MYLTEGEFTQNRSIPSVAKFSRPRKTSRERLSLRGRYFFQNNQKYFLKGVTYGPFAPTQAGVPFPDSDLVETDFAAMSELGVNCIRTFTPPPKWLLDLADSYDLRVIVGIPWAQHISFLDSRRTRADIRASVARDVASCSRHAAVFAYLVGNEIPPEIVRWYGGNKIGTFLGELVDCVKSLDHEAFVSYANFPSTEYLQTDFADFLAFNVYLHRESDFRR